MISIRYLIEWSFIYNECLLEKLNVITCVETWARNGFKKSNMRQEVCKRKFTLVSKANFDFISIFIQTLAGTSDSLKKLKHQFTKNIMVLNFGLDYKCDWNKNFSYFFIFNLFCLTWKRGVVFNITVCIWSVVTLLVFTAQFDCWLVGLTNFMIRFIYFLDWLHNILVL